MKHFFVVANRDNSDADEAMRNITEYIRSRGGICVCADDVSANTGRRGMSGGYRYTDPESVPANTECIIVLGGDGTLLQTARDLIRLELPYIGINYGNLGFLSEIEKTGAYETIDRLIDGQYTIEDRMMIKGSIVRRGNVVAKDVALNDIVINRCGNLRIIDFNISVNGQYLNSYRADGMIISTPTGSTAYNMSAGGPIIKPSASLIVVTPICPHTFNTRSIILEADDVIEIEILEGKKTRQTCESGYDRMVAFDGDNEAGLMNGDRIVITKSDKCTKIIRLSRISFLQILRRKMACNENSQTE